MLELATLEHQSRLENPEPVNLKAVVEAELESFGTRSGATITADLEDSVIEGDPFLLRQALRNVLDNAVEHGDERGEIVVTVSANSVSVRDYGGGIPGFALDRVYDRFYSLPNGRTGRKRTGLGLAFVKQIVSLHRGDITIENVDPGVMVTLDFD